MKWFKCYYCKQEKTENNFYKNKYSKTGFKPRCKKCEKLGLNWENRRKYEKLYRKHNKKRRAAIVKKSMMKNIEHHKAIRKKYLKTELGIASYKKYTQKRYAIKKSSFVENVDIKQLYIENGGFCEYCKTPLKFKQIHIDHYIPLSRGGKHKKDNLKISCPKCNQSKGGKMPFEWEVCYQMV